MHDIYKVIHGPVVTEKSSAQKAESNKVVFEVAPWANKVEVRQAVERIFSVKVTDVQTMNIRGKLKRIGKYAGFRQNWKKAVVTLAEGAEIDVLGTGAQV
jgi:large subunit ribosomal protein L23